MSSENLYKLEFHGLADDKPETKARLSNTLTLDLGLQPEEIEKLIRNSPIVLQESTDQNDLLPLFMTLEASGAKVVILDQNGINPLTVELEKVEAKYADQLGDPDSNNELENKNEPETVEDDFLSFELDDPSDSLKPIDNNTSEAQKDSTKDNESDDALQFSLDDKPEIPEPKPIIKEDSLSFESDLDVSLNLPQETAELTEAPLKEITLDTNDDDDSELSFEENISDDKETTIVEKELSPPKNSTKDIAEKSEEIGTDIKTEKNNDDIFADSDEDTFSFDGEEEEKQEKQATEAKKVSEGILQDLNKDDSESSEPYLSETTVAKTLGSTESLSFLQKHKRHIGIVLEYGIPVLFGIIIIMVVSKLFLPDYSKEELTMEGKKEQVKIAEVQARQESIEYRKYSGDTDTNSIITKVKVTTTNENINSASIEITPPKPPALTPEDLVLNKSLQPWVETIIIERIDFNKSTKNDKTSFLGVAKARIKVHHNQSNLRLLVPVAARAIYDSKSDEVKVAIIIKTGFKNLKDNKDYEINITDNNTVNLILKSNIALKRVETQKGN